jgi:alkylhydroperoxidase/carboxymuconolactone decarboxylase family protein YurZ
MGAARQAKASKDEILDAIFHCPVIGQTRVLASALRTFQELEKKEAEAE